MADVQRDIFSGRGSESSSRPQYALPVMNQVASKLQEDQVFTAGTDFTVAAGAAGAAVTIYLPYGPILGNYGRTGNFGNSTLVLGAALATTLDTEVAFIPDAAQRTGDVTSLSNGEYMVDYETGIIYGKRADNGTTGTATYSYWLSGSVAGTGTLANQVQGTAASGAVAVGNPVQTGGVYNTSAPTLDNGDVGALQLDVNANLKTVGQYMPVAEDNTNGYYNTTRKYTATSTDKGTKGQNNSFATANVKNTAGSMVWANIINTTASVRYFQLHNTATTPAGGATAAYKWQIPANGYLTLDADLLGANGANLQTGIAIANSSTAATYTAGSAGDLLVDYITI